jgi:hypothetical protein
MEPASHPVALGNKEQALVTNTKHRKGLTCKEVMPLSEEFSLCGNLASFTLNFPHSL